jgi:hypothetical protein
MAIDHLKLPKYNEPPPRLPVVARYVGPVLAALRHPGGYRFMPTSGGQDGAGAWIGRAVPRRV